MTELPSGALPVRITAHVTFNIFGLHAGIVVPGFVVFAHMLEAELIILTQLAIFGRTKFPMTVTVWPIAFGQDRFVMVKCSALVAVSSVHVRLYVLDIAARNIIRFD